MNADDLEAASGGLLFTLGWQAGAAKTYALEASIFNTGSTMQWLRDGLGIISDAAESSDIAVLLGDNDGVYLVPAFSGLGSPHWDPHARASITGVSRGTTKDHLIRAALESTAYQVKEVVDIMDSQLRLPRRGNRRERVLRVDGGQTRNPFLMQFQADLLDRPIEVSAVDETTALGAAFLAGRAAGVWRSDRELANLWNCARRYEPDMSESERGRLISGMERSVAADEERFCRLDRPRTTLQTRRFPMPLQLDHTIVPAHDKVKSAKFIARIFGVEYKGTWGHFAPVKVNDIFTLDFRRLG